MSQSDTPRTSATELNDGDRVMMGINAHGLATDLPGVEYHEELRQAGVVGTVVIALSDGDKQILSEEDWRPMADLKVEADDGTVYTWHVDNGYVTGPNLHDEGPNRTDVGKVGGFYDPEAL